jgi:GTP-binding protein EngB required for normal cell division
VTQIGMKADGVGDQQELIHRAVEVVSDLRQRYQISAIEPFLESCRTALSRSDLSVGVLGRFKAGKSSFLNQLIGRPVLPVGVIPVTAVVTGLSGGAIDSAIVRFTDGTEKPITLDEVSRYASETGNPDNGKGVLSVSITLPEMLRFGGLRLFDTPGLESAFIHNTEASQQWAPNVDVALVAVAVDPPLSRQDLTLIRKLLEYTPRVAILLTKFDLLGEEEQTQVLDFVKEQLRKNVEEKVEVFPYSTKAGYEHLERSFAGDFIGRVTARISDERRVIQARKVRTLVRECGDYMRLTLRSTELLDSEKSHLRAMVLGEKNALEDTKLELRLVARHAIAGCRSAIEDALSPEEKPMRRRLLTALERTAPSFPASLDRMTDAFQAWLETALSVQLREVSEPKEREFQQPLLDVRRQYLRLLQTFRDRLSDRVMELYGVPLRTTEPDIVVDSPKVPDVKIGRVFDHSWELLSPVLPMSLLRRAVMRRFRNRIGPEVFKNLSRLTTQWQDIVGDAIFQLQEGAERRMEDLIATVDRLTSVMPSDTQSIRQDVNHLDTLARQIGD